MISFPVTKYSSWNQTVPERKLSFQTKNKVSGLKAAEKKLENNLTTDLWTIMKSVWIYLITDVWEVTSIVWMLKAGNADIKSHWIMQQKEAIHLELGTETHTLAQKVLTGTKLAWSTHPLSPVILQGFWR